MNRRIIDEIDEHDKINRVIKISNMKWCGHVKNKWEQDYEETA